MFQALRYLGKLLLVGMQEIWIGEVGLICRRLEAAHVLQEDVDVLNHENVGELDVVLELENEVSAEVLIEGHDFVDGVDVSLAVEVAERAIERLL